MNADYLKKNVSAFRLLASELEQSVLKPVNSFYLLYNLKWIK